MAILSSLENERFTLYPVVYGQSACDTDVLKRANSADHTRIRNEEWTSIGRFEFATSTL